MNNSQPTTKSVDASSLGAKQEPKPSNLELSFDQWAIAVRQQMLDSLRKRGARY